MKTRKTIPLNLALLVVILIAAVATIIIFVQFDQKKKIVAATELSKAEQESYVMTVFDRIESNLAKISEKESMIRKDFTTNDNSGTLSPEERIQHEIEFIEHLIEENNMLIASLNKQVKDQDSRLQDYESTVRDLKSRVNEYQVYLDKLTAEKQALQAYLDETTADRNRLSARVDTLNSEIAQTTKDLTEWINKTIEKEDELNTAYYAIGPYKVLRDKEILHKEGGFLGINRVTTLTGNPDPELFHEIDIRDITQIPVYAKRWEIVTGQDPSSFELSYDNNEVNWITITDPAKFWNKTKYLVIVIRDKEDSELALSR